MSSKRGNIPRSVLRKINTDYCAKCGRKEALNIHHIKAVVDGGDNSPENLVCLCMACHREWHALNVGSSFPFSEWIQMPTLLNLLVLISSLRKMNSNDLQKLNGESVLNIAMDSHEIFRSFRIVEED